MAAAMPPSELLRCRPERAVDAERDGEFVVLLRPRFQRGLLKRWLQPRLRRPHLRVRLDEVGSFVWDRCDGNTTVAEIAESLAAHFGDRVNHALERLTIFVTQMQRGGVIRLLLPAEAGHQRSAPVHQRR
jgi:hypothetical protein